MEHGRQSQRRPRTTGIRTIPINCFPAYTQRKHRHARTDTRTHTRAQTHTHACAHPCRGNSRFGSPARSSVLCASPASGTQLRTPRGSGPGNHPPPANPTSEPSSVHPGCGLAQESSGGACPVCGDGAGGGMGGSRASSVAGVGPQAASLPPSSPCCHHAHAPNTSMLSRGSLPLLTASLLQQQVCRPLHICV